MRAYLVRGLGDRIELPVRDVSQGGAFLYARHRAADVGERLSVELVVPEGTVYLVLAAQVVRTAEGSPGFFGIGLKFVDVSDSQNERLKELLRLLLEGPGGDRRSHPRVALRKEVLCSGAREFRALLRDLSYGGASLWSEQLLQSGEVLKLSFARPGYESLRLDGRVVFAQPAADGEPFHQIGVRFDRSADELKPEIDTLFVHTGAN